MIDKQAYYHGAAIVQLLDDSRFVTIKKHDLGYIVNDAVVVLVKYRTNNRTPWRFTFTLDEMVKIETLIKKHIRVVLAMTCGGDGICTISAVELMSVMGDNPGWVAVKRNYNEQYAVAGPCGALERKVTFQRWPAIVFESASDYGCRKG